MKEFDYRRLDHEPDRTRDRQRDGTARGRDAGLDVAESLHRAGAELPVRLAALRTQSPGKYRQALAAMNLGPLGARRLDAQIELLAASPDHDIAAELRRRRAASEGLHAGLRSRAESALGMGLGHVRVFHGAQAQDMARRHGAAAFVWGSNIVLGQGVRNVPSAVMAEEVAHVAQQRGASRGPVTLTPKTAPAERSARGAVTNILAGRRAAVGRVGRRSIMRVERDSVSEEERNPRDLSPQFGSMEARSDDELQKIVNDEKGRPRYVKRGYIYAPEQAGSVTLELWLAAFDELQKRKKGPRGKGDEDEGGGEAHQAMGQSYAPDEAVQRKGTGRPGAGINVQRVARSGFRGGGQRLPYLTQLQRSFGKHDLAGVRAYVGGSAVLANQRLRARAYAMGENVAFARAPDLHTVAHEAAHVVQQRRGASVPGGLSKPGDAYERHADAVADSVVAGRSAESLLEGVSRRPTLSVQRVGDEDALDETVGVFGHTNTIEIKKWELPGGVTASGRLKIGTGDDAISLPDEQIIDPKATKSGVKFAETESKIGDAAKGWMSKFTVKFATWKLEEDLFKHLGVGEGLKFETPKVELGSISTDILGEGAKFELVKFRVRASGDVAKALGFEDLSVKAEITFDFAIDLGANDAFKAALEATGELAEAVAKRQAEQRTAELLAKQAQDAADNPGRLRRLAAKTNVTRRAVELADDAVRAAHGRLRSLGTKIGTKVGGIIAKTLGRNLLRLVPGIGLAMTVYDIWQMGSFVVEFFSKKTKTLGDQLDWGSNQDGADFGNAPADGTPVDGDAPSEDVDAAQPVPQGQEANEGSATAQDEGYSEAEGALVSWIKALYVVEGFLHVELYPDAIRVHPGRIAELRSGSASFTLPGKEEGTHHYFGGKLQREHKNDERHLFVFRRRGQGGKGTGGTGGRQADGGGGGRNAGKSYAGAGEGRRNGESGGDNQGRGAGVSVEGQDAGRSNAGSGSDSGQSETEQMQAEIEAGMSEKREARHRKFQENVEARAEESAGDVDKVIEANRGEFQLESPAAKRGLSAKLREDNDGKLVLFATVTIKAGEKALDVVIKAVAKHHGVSPDVARTAVNKLGTRLFGPGIPSGGIEGTHDILIGPADYELILEALGKGKPK